MKKIYSILLLALLLPPTCLKAQHKGGYEGKIIYQGTFAEKNQDNVIIDLVLNLKEIKMRSQEMVVLTPLLSSANNTMTFQFDPIVITGGKRDKALNRALLLGDFQLEHSPQMIVRRYNKKNQQIEVQLVAPYQSWMNQADLLIHEQISGCAGCEVGQKDYSILHPVLPKIAAPVFELLYVIPPVEVVKQRDETHIARLQFEVGKYEILRNYKNNAEVLNEVDDILTSIIKDPNLSVNLLKVVGYASPEGNTQSNYKLSENRAKVFSNYLLRKHALDSRNIQVEWEGEDWKGLAYLAEGLSFPDRDRVLDIIDFEPNADKRKNQLKALSGGTTYQMLLHNYYPILRRSEYTIRYTSRAFTLGEAKELIRTRPHHLSVNEIFQVAESFPQGSNEFKDALEIAVKTYPDNPIAQNNKAVMEIENGDYEKAIQRLEKIDTPEAWNNLGVIYCIHRQDYQKAKKCFQQAKEKGVEKAAYNLELLENWLKKM